ncbi:MAG: hypothetical protein HY784_12935, partial [Chloroflexi bacterium]|nr:hypothetical protein [Chloroflexota bacterium]
MCLRGGLLAWLLSAMLTGAVFAEHPHGEAQGASHAEASSDARTREPDALSAQTAPGVTLIARAGFDGYYKDQVWMPVRITVSNDGPDVSGALRISSPRDYGNSETIFTRAVDLPTQSRREIFIYIAPEGVVSNLKVTLVEKNRIVASATLRLAQAGATDLLYGVLAGSPSAFNGLADVDPVNGSAFVAQLEPGDLPPVVKGWQALDVLVISDVDTGVFTPEQRAALAGWAA